MKVVLKSLILCCMVLSMVTVSNAEPAILITNYTLTPTVLMPGDSAQLQITITNTETVSTTTTSYTGSSPTISTTETNPATIDNIWIVADGIGTRTIKAHDNIPDIGVLAPGASVTVSFTMTAHENITEGVYYPVAHIDVEASQDVQYPIPIRVSNLTANLLEKNVPAKISTSGSTSITLTAVNKRENPVEDVIITTETPETLQITPKSIYLGTMNSETSEDIIFYLQPTQTNSYNITFTMSYRNGENLHSDTISFPVEVVSTSDVSPVLYTMPKTIAKGTTERISLEVYNAKTEGITGVIIVPMTNLTVSPSQYFIGAMDADDVFSASFDVSAEDMALGNHTISFKVIFKQDNNYFESPIIVHSLEVVTPPPVRTDYSMGLIALTLFVLFAIICLFYILRKRRRRL